MFANNQQKFDIRNFTDRLTPAKGSNRYICPVCQGNNLTIDPNSTKYQCWRGCECSEIREALAPWDEISRKTYRPRNCSRQRKKSRFSAPAPIPDKIELARLPELTTARPSPEKPHWIPKEVPKTALETRYWYSSTQWVSRFQWEDSENPKGYDKTFRQGNIKPDGSFKWNKGKDSWLPYRFDEVLAHGKGKWVLLFEGEECVETGRSLNLVSITLQGSSWSGKAVENALSHLNSEGVAGVIFPRDNDDVGVEKAKKVSAAAAKLQFPCLVGEPTDIWENMPHKGDLVNWVKWGQAQGMNQEKFIERLEKAIHAAVDKCQPASDEDEWDAFSGPLAANPSTGGKRPKPKPESVAQKIADEYRDKWAFHNEQKTWRIWNNKFWESIESEAFTQLVYQTIQAQGIKCERFSFVENVLKFLKAQLLVKKWISFDRRLYINFDNGVLEISTGKLLKHQPGFRFTNCLPRNYSQLATDSNHIEMLRVHCPHFFKWATEAMKGDPHKTLKLVAVINGVIKFRFCDLQMFVHLVGKPGTGKGTFSRLLSKIVGKENTESSRLKKLDNDYELDKIINAQLVICPDEDKQVGDFGGLKSLTGGDAVTYRRIYQAPASSPFFGTLMVISNSPIFAGDTSGLDRRLCLAQFDNPIPATRRDSRTEELLELEIEPLTTVALSLPDELVTQVLRGIGESEIPDFKLAAWEMKMQTDSLAAWLNANLIYDPEAFTPVGTKNHNPACSLYANYCQFCEETGVKAKSLSNFSPHLLELCHEIGWDRVRKSRTKQGYRIHGVRLRTSPDDGIPFYEDTLKPQNPDPEPEGVGGVDFEREGEGQGVDPKPLQDKGGVGGVDLLAQVAKKVYQKVDQAESVDVLTAKPTKTPDISSDPAPSTPASQDKGLDPTPPSHESLHQTTPPTPTPVIDYSSYPHLTSNDIRACQKRALACQQKMLSCTNSEQLAAFRSEGGFSSNEIDWVYRHLLNDAEKDKVHEAAHSVQLDLFNQSTVNSQQNRDSSLMTDDCSLMTEPVLEWEDLIATTDSELERLGWTTEQAVDYLKETYGYSSRQLLSDEQILDFIRALQAMP